MGCCFLLQGIFPTQGSNPGLSHCRHTLLLSEPPGKYAEYIRRNARLDETQAGIKIARKNVNNLRYTYDPTLMAESEEELKSLLMKVKEESENVDLKLNIQKTKIMASGPITSWPIDGETVRHFIWGGSKITADSECSYEIKRCLSLEEKL